MSTKKGGNEDDLLAIALGSSTTVIQNTDTYEENVIRNAELSLTPRLMVSSETNGLKMGFPSLQSLIPSRNVHDAQKVLQTLRRYSTGDINDGNGNDNGNGKNNDNVQLRKKNREKSRLLLNVKDCMKEQILLCLLNSVDNEMGVFPQQEAKQEWKRRKLYREGDDGQISRKKNDIVLQAELKNQGEKDNDRKWNDDEDDTPSGRLERIKKGKTVCFSSDIPTSKSKRSTSLISRRAIIQSNNYQNKRRRISMQERRNQNGDNDECGGVLEEENELQKSKKKMVSQLKQLRVEREERQKRRKRAWRDDDDIDVHDNDSVVQSDSNEAQPTPESSAQAETIVPLLCVSNDNDTGTHTYSTSKAPTILGIKKEGIDDVFDNDIDNDIDDDTKRDGSIVVKRKNDGSLKNVSPQNLTMSSSTISRSSRDFVVCPLCEEKISVPSFTVNTNNSKTDAILAHHMNTCQTKHMRRRCLKNGTSMSTSKSYQVRERKTRSRPNYAEIDSSGEDNEENDDNFVFVDQRPKSYDYDDNLINFGMDDDDDIVSIKSTSKKRQHVPNATSSRINSRKSSQVDCNPLMSIDDWDEDIYEERVDDWIEHGRENMPIMKERDTNEIPPGEEEYDGGLIVPAWINDRLFPYQRTGLQWMWELHRQQAGGILGDEMGLGKTIQVAAFLGTMAASRKVKSLLIVCPATMLQHWLKEMKKWAPGVRRFLIHQSGDTLSTSKQLSRHRTITTQQLSIAAQWLKKSRRDRLFEIIDEEDLETRDPSSFCGTAYVFVTTFENVRRNEDIYINHRWSYVVVDEAQKIRNPNADITLVCKRFKTPHRLALSGTPIQNDLRELWSILDFVFPGRLGTLPAFETEFAFPIKKGGYSNASPMQVQLSYRCALILKDLINPYLLRRLKKDIKEVKRMPGKKEQVLFCRLSDYQRNMYEDFLQSDLVKKVFRGSAQLLGAITMLRKICNHPDLVSPPEEASEQFNKSLQARELDDDDASQKMEDGIADRNCSLIERSGKLEILAKILPLWKKQGHRVLIFCQWRKMLDIIMDFVKSHGWKFGRLDGNTNVASRQRLVDTFNSDDSYFCMLCTTRTGGVGLNMVGADRIILYDPDWNPQTDAQARERAWRFGQEREVTVYRMICAGTVEEKIYQRQIFKTALTNSVLQNSKQRRLFTQKDLKDLFSLKADNGSIVAGAEGITETTELTKGDGYVDPDNEIAAKDDGETMRSVLKSRGLAGIFDHDVVEGNSKSKRASIREMEAKARRLSREALQNLQLSVAPVNDRFGAQRNSLLSSIAERNSEILNASSVDEVKKNTQLLCDLRNFVRSRQPTTNEILEEFSSYVESSDASVFRRLLKSIAILNNGSWILK
mmetsp:Transcript_33130/g.37226  ORF Transcript_33130/g.37226 Transcript_33130/m.37226 type:complete len:1363 (+) Transcript_33130:107-4195(+)